MADKIIPNPVPSWADPKQASVFDPLYKTLIRKAVEWSGMADPANAFSPEPLVSIYKDKAARIAGNRVADVAAAVRLPLAAQTAWSDFSKRYPRIAAHMNPMVKTLDPNHGMEAYMKGPWGKVTSPLEVGITQRGIEAAKKTPGSEGPINSYLDKFMHEGTHVAQNLGNSDFQRLYQQTKKILMDHQNPFEMNAYATGKLPIYGSLWPREGPTAIELLKTKMQRMSDPDLEFAPHIQDTAQGILKILEDRKARGWTPSGK